MAQPLTTSGSNGGRSSTEALIASPAQALEAPSDLATPLFGSLPNGVVSGSSVLASLLAQSSRHLFGPTSQPTLPPKQQVVSIAGLTAKLHYLKPDELALVKKAFHFSDSAHLGQYRQSGEPYITHTVAVAELCASWRLDASSIMAALLHDVIEDTGCNQDD